MRRVRVAVANDYEVIVRGVGDMLERDERIDVVLLVAGLPIHSDVDVVLYDNFGSGESHSEAAKSVMRHSATGKVVAYTDNFNEAVITEALGNGVSGYLSKSLSATALAEAILAIHEGEIVIKQHDEAASTKHERSWPGKEFGLTEREANVLSLIVQGYDNESIAERLYVSINTVKSRIRTLYQKIQVENRVQAALWGVKHGFDPDRVLIWEE